MSDPLFHIKLYGHVSDSTEGFARGLAEILEMTEEEALSLLGRVPVVVAELREKQQAERLRESCASIKGLCIVEQIEEPDTGETLAGQPEKTKSSRDGLAAHIREGLSKSFLFWLSMITATLSIALVLFFLGFSSSYRQLYRKNQPSATGHKHNAESVAPDTSASAKERDLANEHSIKARIEELDQVLKEDRFWLIQEEQSLYKLYRTPNPDPRDIDTVRTTISGLRNSVNTTLRELERLRKSVR